MQGSAALSVPRVCVGPGRQQLLDRPGGTVDVQRSAALVITSGHVRSPLHERPDDFRIRAASGHYVPSAHDMDNPLAETRPPDRHVGVRPRLQTSPHPFGPTFPRGHCSSPSRGKPSDRPTVQRHRAPSCPPPSPAARRTTAESRRTSAAPRGVTPSSSRTFTSAPARAKTAMMDGTGVPAIHRHLQGCLAQVVARLRVGARAEKRRHRSLRLTQGPLRP